MSVSKQATSAVAAWSRRYIENQMKIERDYATHSNDLKEQGYVEIACNHKEAEKMQWLRDNKIEYIVIPRIIVEDGGHLGAYDVEVGQVFLAHMEDAIHFKLRWCNVDE